MLKFDFLHFYIASWILKLDLSFSLFFLSSRLLFQEIWDLRLNLKFDAGFCLIVWFNCKLVVTLSRPEKSTKDETTCNSALLFRVLSEILCHSGVQRLNYNQVNWSESRTKFFRSFFLVGRQMSDGHIWSYMYRNNNNKFWLS